MRAIKKKLRNLNRRICDQNSKQYLWELDIDLSGNFSSWFLLLKFQQKAKVEQEIA